MLIGVPDLDSDPYSEYGSEPVSKNKVSGSDPDPAPDPYVYNAKPQSLVYKGSPIYRRT